MFALQEGKEKRREKERMLEGEATYPAIDMLFDPQGFVEKLFAKLKVGHSWNPITPFSCVLFFV